MSLDLHKLKEQVKKIAEREDCFLYDLELVGQGAGRTLRVFIDKDGSDGVSIDDCSSVSRGLDLVLDVEDLVPGGAYNLEVSSPGLERHLREPWHYEKAQGRDVVLNLNTPLGDILESKAKQDAKRKKLNGVILNCDEQQIKVSDGDRELEIPYQFIHKAKVVHTFESAAKPKNKKAKKG